MRNAIFHLPYLSAKRFGNWRRSASLNIADIPNDFELTNKQSVVREAVRSGNRLLTQNSLRSLWHRLSPHRIPGFETLQMGRSRFSRRRPARTIATQSPSLLCDRPGNVIAISRYLADHDGTADRNLPARFATPWSSKDDR